MSKAITGAVQLAGAVGMGALAVLNPALIANPWFDKVWAGLIMSGISSEIGAIGEAIAGNRSQQISTRQPASARPVVYGTQMVGGVLVFESFTGHQWNQVIALAGHPCDSIQAIFLDGRKVFFQNGGFGGDADGNDHIGPDGVTHYNFGGKCSVFYRLGNQTSGDYMAELHGNDPSWGPNAATGDAPSLISCTYIYLKLTSSNSQFPSRPEVKILVNGKNDIYDPRTTTRGFTNNAALVLADVISDPQFGLGDVNINTEQLIAAANICDEQVAVAALNGQTESRYCCDWTYDTGTAVADVMQQMLTGMAGRYSFVGGEHFIFPGAYVGPSASFDESSITDTVQWNPYRSVRDLPNRVTGTHCSPSWPWSTAGNFYQNRQTVENTFDLKFTSSSYPAYAQDVLHGYPNDEWLTEDQGHLRPMELPLPTVLSLTQCQRVAKINLLRARSKQGSGTLDVHLQAYKVQPCDTLSFTFPQMGWSNEVLEVTGTSLKIDTDNDVPAVRLSMNVQQTSASTYSWSTIEELTIYSAPASPTQTPWVPNPPTNLQLNSGAQTAIVGQDGNVTPVIQVEWDTPLDNAATGILVQYRLSGSSTWYAALTQDISGNVSLISNVVAGKNYDVRIATVRANGATSEWVEQDRFLVPTLNSFLGTLGAQWPGGVNLPAPGADVTAQQAVAYTGISNNLVPNGDFLLRTPQGWYLSAGGGISFDPSVPQLFVGPGGANVCTPTFAVQPGNKYRFTFVAQSTGSSPNILLRVNQGAVYAPNVTDQGISVGFIRYGDLSGGITIPGGSPSSFVYEWTCPSDVRFATLACFNLGDTAMALYHVSAQDYGAAEDWGSNRTQDHTSYDTSYVSGVPSPVIANVVPAGYKLFINTGSRSYSIQAL